MITGIPASPGIVFGKALVLKEEKIVADETPQEEVTEEITTELSNEEKLQQEVDRVEKKLSNEKFVAKAPAAVVEAERAKGADYQAQREAVLERIATLKKI